MLASLSVTAPPLQVPNLIPGVLPPVRCELGTQACAVGASPATAYGLLAMLCMWSHCKRASPAYSTCHCPDPAPAVALQTEPQEPRNAQRTTRAPTQRPWSLVHNVYFDSRASACQNFSSEPRGRSAAADSLRHTVCAQRL